MVFKLHPRLPVSLSSTDGGQSWRIIDEETNNPARDEHGDFLDGGGYAADEHFVALCFTSRLNQERGLALHTGSMIIQCAEKPGSLPTIEVDESLLQVRYAGTVHNVTNEQARMLKAIIEANGEWVKMSGLYFSKPSDVKKTLPFSLLSLIETAPGKGYRLARQS